MNVVFACIALTLTASASSSSNWEFTGEKNGIKTYRREIAGSPIVAFRGEGVIEAPLEKVVSVLLNSERATEWVDSLKHCKILRHLGPHAHVEYHHIGTPFVMKDREFVSKVTTEIDPKTKTFRLRYQPTEDALAPKTSHVRGELMDSSYVLRSLENGTRTYAEIEIFADPKGSVAKWIVNFFQKGWPQNTLEAMRKESARPDIGPLPEFKALFEELRAAMR